MKDTIPETPPEYMIQDEFARTYYEQLSSQLNEIGLVKACHQQYLVQYCELFSRDRKLEKELAVEGVILKNKERGTSYINPKRFDQISISKQMASLFKLLGMSVSAIHKMAPLPQPKADPTDIKDPANFFTS